MEQIRKALTPEALELFRRIPLETPEDRAAQMDRKMRAIRDAREEDDDRNRHERRRAAALAKGET